MAEKYDLVADLAAVLAGAVNEPLRVNVHADRIAGQLGLGEDDSAETVAAELRKALGLAHGSLGDPARVRVTVTDLDTGDSEAEVIADDYFMTCAGSCYVDHVQVYSNGTHVITVKGRARRAGVPGEVPGNA